MAASDAAPLRICVVSVGDASRNPRLAPLAATLRDAGNNVSVATGPTRESMPDGADVIAISARVPAGGSRLVRYVRRIVPQSLQTRLFERRIVQAAVRSGASLFYPLARRDVDAAIAAAGPGGAVFCPPNWQIETPRDVARLAPADFRWSTSSAGPGLLLHLARPDGPGSTPKPGRHAGRRVALVYRGATTSPGRYLQAALERAGVTVDHFDNVLDYDRIDRSVEAVVFVESAYPAFDVAGSKPDVPTLFWVHHGEHHLEANIRLAQRYGADAILLAHSWHLAHRFGVPVHRFPFGAAQEISGAGRAFNERRYDVAMVAAGLEAEGGAYTKRQAMASALVGEFGDRSRFTYGVLPEELGDLYRDSRVVLNDGGTNHHPITMRVFEAIGNGARLLTEDVPGMDCLLEPGQHYLLLEEEVVAGTRRVLADADSVEAAAEARAFMMGHHTYGHRVDELLAIVDVTESSAEVLPALDANTLAGVIDAEVDAQVVADFGDNSLGSALPTREIRDGRRYVGHLRARSVDAVVLGPDVPVDVAEAVAAARSCVYATGEAIESVVAGVENMSPEAMVERLGSSIVRIDLGRGGYRKRPPDHPLA